MRFPRFCGLGCDKRKHSHEQEQKREFKNNAVALVRGGRTITFKAGHLVLLGSNLPHFWVSDPDCQHAEACVVQFKPEIFGEHLLLLPELARVKTLLAATSRGVAFSRLMTAQAVPLMMRLGSESGAKRLLTLLELTLLSRDAQSRTLCAAAYHLQESAEAKRRVEAVYRYLSAHFREPCSVPEVAKALGMNEGSFSRFFRHETGFGNLANFNRRFRWHYRMTPKEYRKRWAQEEMA